MIKKIYPRNRKKQQDAQRKNNYGISGYQYDQMVLLQLGGCAICKQPCSSGESLSVDHDHKTGKIRGLLCGHCNRALGLLKEDEDIIWNMLEYLKRTVWNIKSA